MLTVHHLGISQSDRIVWLCEELGIDYALKRYDRDPQTRGAPDAYRALSPFGTAPVITDDDTGLVLGETGAIVDYILAVYADEDGRRRLTVAPGAANYADYLFWLHFANGSFVPATMMEMTAKRMGGTSMTPPGVPSRLDRAFALAEARLGDAPYFAGPELTVADIVMVFSLTTMRAFSPRDLSGSPNTLAYLDWIGMRPAYRRAMAKADPELVPQSS